MFPDTTFDELSKLESSSDYRTFFNCSLSSHIDSEQWELFFGQISNLDEQTRRQQFDQRFKEIIKAYKELDSRILSMRNGLKKSFFNSIISCRDLIREGGMLQHKLHLKTQSKLVLLDKIQSELREDLKYYRVIREFKNTYAKSKQEVDRRSKFDFLVVGFLRVILRLAKEENVLRKKFLKEWSGLLPETFCPFLVNLISEQLIRQNENHFLGETSIQDFDTDQVSSLFKIKEQLDGEEIALALRNLLEEYMTCAEALSPIHQTLAFALNSECESVGPNFPKQRNSREYQGLPSRFSMKIRPEDLKAIDSSKTFLRIDAHTSQRYLSFDVEVHDCVQDADGLSVIAASLSQQCSPSASENSSFMMLCSQA
jgi:hypothetical protein